MGLIAAPGAMVYRCKACGERARDADNSCSNFACACFRPSQSGRHWASKRAKANKPLGTRTAFMGSFITGSFAFSLHHRHDIRVGIASGMYLKPLILDRAKRLELLAVLYPCYWRWSTKLMLERILAHLDQYLVADALGRSEIIEKALQSMTREMVAYQVVGFRKKQRLELMSRTHAKRFNAKKMMPFGTIHFRTPQVGEPLRLRYQCYWTICGLGTYFARAKHFHRRGRRTRRTASLLELYWHMASNCGQDGAVSMAERGCLP